MKIERNFTSKNTTFNEVFLKGEAFRRVDGECIFIPLSENYDFNSSFFNAVNLDNMKLAYFPDGQIVEPLKSKLIVENY